MAADKVITNFDLATSLAARGWYVFPCHESPWNYRKNGELINRKAKEPYWHKDDLPHGKDNASIDPGQITIWWNRWPGALIGIYCEKSGIFALDIDKKDKDGWQSLFDLLDKHNAANLLPQTGPAQNTPSGGAHYIYKLPAAAVIPNNANQLAEGLDLRSNGYICTGGAYSWIPEHGPESALTEAPDWLIEEIANIGQKTQQALPRNNGYKSSDRGEHWLRKALNLASEGSRNDRGYWLASQLRDADYTESEAKAYMQRYAESVPGTGYTVTEALKTLESAYKLPKRQEARRNGSQAETQNETTQAASSQNSESTQGKERRKDPLGAEYVAFLRTRGYDFKLCSLDDSLWVNDERISDPLEAEIKTLLRDNGYGRVNVAADAWLAHARKNSFNPIKGYLNGLKWNGLDHIGQLASHVSDKHNNFALVLRKWAIGAVARPLTGGRQNRVMVFEGKQGTGKSFLARWIASPLEDYFSEAMPNPDDKDSRLALATTWIWEIKELGAVTRRADRESLKAWLTLQGISERPPFGKHVIYKPAITSFIATVNNEGGFFNDPTGSRRYMTVAIDGISWDYSKHVDINQLWAQAVHLFKAGEDWNLSTEEQTRIEAVNDEYEFTPPVYDWLDMWIEPDNTDNSFLPVSDVMNAIKAAGVGGTDTHIIREVAAWMKRNGYEDGRSRVDISVVGVGKMKRLVRGYFGVKILVKGL